MVDTLREKIRNIRSIAIAASADLSDETFVGDPSHHRRAEVLRQLGEIVAAVDRMIGEEPTSGAV